MLEKSKKDTNFTTTTLDETDSHQKTQQEESCARRQNSTISSESCEPGECTEKRPLLIQNQQIQQTLHTGLWKHGGLSKGDIVASKASLLSTASGIQCRICQSTVCSSSNPLISPCRCSGSLLYIHRGCLVFWLEMSTNEMMPSPSCELCGYNYKRDSCRTMRSVHFPKVGWRDILMNVLFVFAMTSMFASAAMAFHFLRRSERYYANLRGYRVVSDGQSFDDVAVLVCSSLFFVAFFAAILTQYRAKASIFRVCFRIYVVNRNWTIRNYDIQEDPEMLERRARRSLCPPIVAPPTSGFERKGREKQRIELPHTTLPITVIGANAQV